MHQLKALLWDVDGTLAETERDGHRVAFNLAFEEVGLPWHWSVAQYGQLLRVTGGRERLLHAMAQRSDAPRAAAERESLARAVHLRKNAHYADRMRRFQMPLRGGVADLMAQCRDSGLPMGITTTTSRSNVEALLGSALGPQWRDWFAVVVCGEDVQRRKPDPQVYRMALEALGIGPHEAVALEDSPSGVAAARAAGIPVVVVRSAYFANATIEGAVAIGPALDTRSGWLPWRLPDTGSDRVGLEDIACWCAARNSVSQAG